MSVKDNIRRAITQINQEEETTILLTTHDLSDIEQLCDRIFMIDKGKRFLMERLASSRRPLEDEDSLFELTPGQSHLVSHYEGLFLICPLIDKGNTLNIEFDSSRYQSADIIKQTLSDF